jgi:hypothetical protein
LEHNRPKLYIKNPRRREYALMPESRRGLKSLFEMRANFSVDSATGKSANTSQPVSSATESSVSL